MGASCCKDHAKPLAESDVTLKEIPDDFAVSHAISVFAAIDEGSMEYLRSLLEDAGRGAPPDLVSQWHARPDTISTRSEA